jgi:hypothetical protein
MFRPFHVEHYDIGPWGQTTVYWKQTKHDLVPPALAFQGHADVATNEISVRLVQHGASVVTTTYLFGAEQIPFRPIQPLTNLCGLLLRTREHQTIAIRPSREELLSLTIGPTDIIVHGDDTRIIREIQRVPLAKIAALVAEALLPPEREHCTSSAPLIALASTPARTAAS